MKFIKIAKKLKEYSSKEKTFIFFMLICGFMICAEAAITKSVSTSFFLQFYGPKSYPYAWIISLPLNYLIVFFYNKTIAKYGCISIMKMVLLFTIFFNIICFAFIKTIVSLSFFLYLWKEVFIMFMLHNLWSVIHSSVNLEKAKYLYGIFFAAGGFGSVAGSIFSAVLPKSFGSEALLLLTLPLYIITFYSFKKGVTIRNDIKFLESISLPMQKEDMKYGLNLIKNSKTLKFILFAVVAMQISATLTEYQFGIFLKDNFQNLDDRTAYFGKVLSVVNFLNIFIQLFGAFLLIKGLGVLNVHLMIPLTLLFGVIISLFYKQRSILTFNYGLIKCYDYSLFGIVTAMLYSPLTIEEKFRAKSFIDILAYRGAKALASLLLCISSPKIVLILILCTWSFISIKMKKIKEKVVV